MKIVWITEKLLNNIKNNVVLDRTLVNVAVHLTNLSIVLNYTICNGAAFLAVSKISTFTFVYEHFKKEDVMFMYNLKIFE
jgi:hypothetical protein